MNAFNTLIVIVAGLYLQQLYCCKFNRYYTETTVTTVTVVSVAAVAAQVVTVAAFSLCDTDIFMTDDIVVSVAAVTTFIIL